MKNGIRLGYRNNRRHGFGVLAINIQLGHSVESGKAIGAWAALREATVTSHSSASSRRTKLAPTVPLPPKINARISVGNRDQDAGALGLVTDVDFCQIRQRIPNMVVPVRLGDEQQKAAATRTAQFAADGASFLGAAIPT